MMLWQAKKVNFVNKLREAIVPVVPNVIDIEYKIFQNVEQPNCIKEYLIITYEGGARTVRICSGNSCSAIFEEIGKYLNHGYYDEEREYALQIESQSELWEELKLY